MLLSNIIIKEKYWVLADQVVVSASAFLTNLLLARALGLMEYGKFTVVTMIQLLLFSGTMAFGAQVYQVVYPSLNKEDKGKLTAGMLSQQLLLALGILALIPVLYAVQLRLNNNWLYNNRTLVVLAIIAT